MNGMPAPPMWDDTSGGLAGYFEQGVYNPEGVGTTTPGGQKQMKMVGFGPMGGAPVFEGDKGLMQCGVNPETGQYMTDAEGNARCWYVPTTSGSHRTVGSPGGGMGSWVDTDRDIVRYNTGVGVMGLAVPVLVFLALFAYRTHIVKRVNKGDEPGVLGKLVMPETWKIWGNKYTKRSSKVFGAPKRSKAKIEAENKRAIEGYERWHKPTTDLKKVTIKLYNALKDIINASDNNEPYTTKELKKEFSPILDKAYKLDILHLEDEESKVFGANDDDDDEFMQETEPIQGTKPMQKTITSDDDIGNKIRYMLETKWTGEKIAIKYDGHHKSSLFVSCSGEGGYDGKDGEMEKVISVDDFINYFEQGIYKSYLKSKNLTADNKIMITIDSGEPIIVGQDFTIKNINGYYRFYAIDCALTDRNHAFIRIRLKSMNYDKRSSKVFGADDDEKKHWLAIMKDGNSNKVILISTPTERKMDDIEWDAENFSDVTVFAVDVYGKSTLERVKKYYKQQKTEIIDIINNPKSFDDISEKIFKKLF